MKSGQRISIDPASLNSRRVEEFLKEQQALARNRAYARIHSQQDAAPSGVVRPGRGRWKWTPDAVTYMAAVGLLGGLVAWAVLAAVLRFEHGTQAHRAGELVAAVTEIEHAVAGGKLTAADGESAVRQFRRAGRQNPYFLVAVDPARSEAQRAAHLQELHNGDARRQLVIRVFGFGASGFLIALFLAVAEPARNRNAVAALSAGALAGLAGLTGGVIIALLAERAFTALGGSLAAGVETDAVRQLAARAATWGALGLLLTLGPALAMRSSRKFAVASLGGMVGGLVGGVLVETIGSSAAIPHAGELVGLVSIGVVAGAGAGMVERVAGCGVLRVTAGLLAGKQFMLYRPCTYIGSAPNCHIFVFKDPLVGRRHAAVHQLPDGRGFEVEDFPLGAATEVNGRPVIARRRLRPGDVVRIGATTLLYEERAGKSAGSFGLVHASLLGHMLGEDAARADESA